MKNSKILFILSFLTTFFSFSCNNVTSEQEPQLTQPEVSLALSTDSPQTSVIISWTASNDATDYSIQRTMIRDGITDYRFFNWRSNTPLSITDDTCESDTEYTYIVTAEAYRNGPSYSTIQYTKDSEPKSIKTENVQTELQLNFPSNVKVTPCDEKINALTVSWDAVKNAEYYEVYCNSTFYINHNEYFKKIAEVKETSFTIDRLYNQQKYTFMIKISLKSRLNGFYAYAPLRNS